MKSAIVTGANGFVGTWLTKKLLEENVKVYAVVKDENEDIIEKFLSQNENFTPINLKELWAKKIDAPYPCKEEKYLRMSPRTTSTDGFFVCILERLY